MTHPTDPRWLMRAVLPQKRRTSLSKLTLSEWKQIHSFIRGYDQHDPDLYTWFYIFFPVFSHMVFPGTTKQSAETMSQTHQGCCHGFSPCLCRLRRSEGWLYCGLAMSIFFCPTKWWLHFFLPVLSSKIVLFQKVVRQVFSIRAARGICTCPARERAGMMDTARRWWLWSVCHLLWLESSINSNQLV